MSLIIEEILSEVFLHRWLPKGVRNIKTVLQSRADDEKMAAKEWGIM